jgi:hypothetical protein
VSVSQRRFTRAEIVGSRLPGILGLNQLALVDDVCPDLATSNPSARTLNSRARVDMPVVPSSAISTAGDGQSPRPLSISYVD